MESSQGGQIPQGKRVSFSWCVMANMIDDLVVVENIQDSNFHNCFCVSRHHYYYNSSEESFVIKFQVRIRGGSRGGPPSPQVLRPQN